MNAPLRPRVTVPVRLFRRARTRRFQVYCVEIVSIFYTATFAEILRQTLTTCRTQSPGRSGA